MRPVSTMSAWPGNPTLVAVAGSTPSAAAFTDARHHDQETR